MESFYQTVTSFCFTLIGLWWGVVQFRHAEWMHDHDHRRMAYLVNLSFLVPGLMSLGAMVGLDTRIIWQAVFIVAGTLGGIAFVVMSLTIKSDIARGWVFQWGRWLVALLYAFVIVIALAPDLTASLNLKPLQVEGILLALIVFLGTSLAWEVMAAPKNE